MRRPFVTVTLNPAVDLTVRLPGLSPGSVHRAESARPNAGGKGLNVATWLALAGEPVVATGFLGEDNAGLFARHCRDLGITDDFVRVPGETRVNLKLVEPGRGRTTDVNLPGLAPSAPARAELAGRLRARVAPGDWVLVAGSLPPGMGTAHLRELLDLLRSLGARVAVDTSGPALAAALAGGVELAKPNLDELADLLGTRPRGERGFLAAARDLQARGARRVALSLGRAGALLVDPDGSAARVAAPAVEVASTVGAGDAMVAGILLGLAREDDLARRARLGAAFAACRLRSPEPSLPRGRALEALVAGIEARPAGVRVPPGSSAPSPGRASRARSPRRR